MNRSPRVLELVATVTTCRSPAPTPRVAGTHAGGSGTVWTAAPATGRDWAGWNSSAESSPEGFRLDSTHGFPSEASRSIRRTKHILHARGAYIPAAFNSWAANCRWSLLNRAVLAPIPKRRWPAMPLTSSATHRRTVLRVSGEGPPFHGWRHITPDLAGHLHGTPQGTI